MRSSSPLKLAMSSRTIHWMDLCEEERERYTRFVVENKVQVRDSSYFYTPQHNRHIFT